MDLGDEISQALDNLTRNSSEDENPVSNGGGNGGDGGVVTSTSDPINDVDPKTTATEVNDVDTDTTSWGETATAPITEAETTAMPSANPSSTEDRPSSTFTSQPSSSITSASSNDTQSDNDSGDGGMSNSTKIAIAVPIAVVGAAIIAAVLFFLLRRRRRQRKLDSRPVISTPQMDNSSSVFLPQQQPQIQPVPLPAATPIARRPVPQGPYVEPVEPASTETNNVVAAGAARDLEWRTSEERGGRPRSPFEHPRDNDDNLSIVSGISDREAMMRARGPRDDDMSSVSSFEDEPRPSTTNRGS
ncbi:hypothetical protein BJX64DRAFT_145424 [Aspergillus heterothallicus]